MTQSKPVRQARVTQYITLIFGLYPVLDLQEIEIQRGGKAKQRSALHLADAQVRLLYFLVNIHTSYL